MGQTDSHEYDLEATGQDDPLIRIELANYTPIVGVELKPIVHLKSVGGCVFEWRRMAKVKRRLLSTSASQHDMLEQHSTPTSSQQTSTADKEFSLSDLKPISLPDPSSRSVLHRVMSSSSENNTESAQNSTTLITNVGVPSELRSVASMSSFRFLPAKDRKGVLVSQGVNYVPSQQDIGHPLKFSVTYIGYKHSITSYIETNPTIPLPARTPARNWLNSSQQTNEGNSSVFDTFSSKFTVMTYNITGQNLVKMLKEKQMAANKNSTSREMVASIYPNCPDYVFTDVYRKKLLLKEIFSFNSDIICLQSIHEQLYNEWHIELSKSGYSGVFKTMFTNLSSYSASSTTKSQTHSGSDDVDYCAEEKLGACVLYRRGKFNKQKDWIIKLENDADVTSLLNKLVTNQCINVTEKENIINECRANRNFGIICEMEFKDMYEMMQKFQKKVPEVNFSRITLLLATVNMYQQQNTTLTSLSPLEKEIVSLIQSHLLLGKLRTIIRDEEYEKNGSKVAVIISGDFDSNYKGMAYRYLSQLVDSEDMVDDETPSASPPHSSDEEEDVDEFENDSDEQQQQQVNVKSPIEESNSKILSHFVHQVKLDSSFKRVTGREMMYTLSDICSTRFDATEFTFFTPDSLKVTRVADEPSSASSSSSNRTFPNIYFSSDHLSMISEFDLDVF